MAIQSSDHLLNKGRALSSSSIYSIFLAILAVLLVVQAVRFLWVIMTPVGPVGDWQAREVQVLSWQSRLALFSNFDPFYRAGPAATANVVTSLQLTLFGTRMNEGSGLGSAILAGPDGVQDSFAVGDEIMSGVTLDAVEFDHVVIDRGGTKESLYLDQSIPAETVGADDSVNGSADNGADGANSAIAGALDNVVDLSPRNEEGRVTGIVVTPRGDGALFQSAGFKDGDIIVSVNGQPVTSTTDIATLKRQIAPGKRLSVEVERGANTVPIAVNLGGQ
ncbi:MAG: type II secretion system protein N [Parasphingorhabdus sp.]|uniref:type II secretion system protein N n=1 Tax=Parasphingorhabdus sp. TaxID=2709688 RepID=UPI003299D43D